MFIFKKNLLLHNLNCTFRIVRTTYTKTKITRMKTLLFLATLFGTTIAFGNNNRPTTNLRDGGGEVITMRIQSQQIDCKGANDNAKCFQVQKGASIGKDNWEVLPETIEGFNFEEGFTYDVTVQVERVVSQTDDNYSFKYVLVNVISKKKE